ncbi:MAG: sugar ABC transporter permease [Chloroflexi bacterium]|jgi:multiple sugar transport system permease protein|nr:sugar ABC transporter permease [Chloroflexota bacterium]
MQSSRASALPWARLSSRDRRGLITGLLFISPWLIGFLALTIYPLIYSFYVSLTRYDLLRPPVFIGMANYVELFTKDAQFWKVVYNTIFYVIFSVPLSLGFSFLVANLLNARIVGRSFFRAVMYIPAIVPGICTAMVWLFLLNIQYGAINGLLQSFGLPSVPFLSNPDLAKPSLIMVAVWATGNAVVVFLAGLQDVPRSLYEAATVDGANGWQQFRNITIPMSTPVILYNLVIGFIGAFQEFTSAYLIFGVNGGPLNSALLYSPFLYQNAFQYLRMGKASALAWLLFIVVVIGTMMLFRSSARWVYYGGEK